MAYENLLLEIREGVAYITFNRPDRLNALNRETIREFSEVLALMKKDKTVRVLVLTGTGDKAFVAGADISELVALKPIDTLGITTMGHRTFLQLESMNKPSIAAVNGYALGGGCEIAMACSLRLASDNALFGFPEVGIGTIPGYGGTQRLPRLVGKGRALEMLLTGDPIDAKEAFRIGLVNHVTTRQDLMPMARKMATRIIKNGPIALRLTLKVVNQGMDTSLDMGCSMESLSAAVLTSTDDMKEGTNAFLEKRNPKFRGI